MGSELLLLLGAPALAVGSLIALWRVIAFLYHAGKVADKVYHELVPNNGMSLRDAVDRIEITLDSELQGIKSRLNRLEGKNDRRESQA